MNWTNYVGSLPGSAIPLDNSMEASIAYSAFLENAGEEGDNVTLAQFLSEYWTRLSDQDAEDF